MARPHFFAMTFTSTCIMTWTGQLKSGVLRSSASVETDESRLSVDKDKIGLNESNNLALVFDVCCFQMMAATSKLLLNHDFLLLMPFILHDGYQVAFNGTDFPKVCMTLLKTWVSEMSSCVNIIEFSISYITGQNESCVVVIPFSRHPPWCYWRYWSVALLLTWINFNPSTDM